MAVGPCGWPPRLAYLRTACAADEVASTLRHEALNEIAGLGALIYRLRRRLEAHPQLGQEAGALLEALEARLASSPARLATRFLDSPQLGARTDLPAAVREVCAALREPGGGALPVELAVNLSPAESPLVAVGAEELQVAVGCLLENAIEAQTRTGASGPVLLGVRAERDRRILEVRDQGPALAGHVVERLLDPFFTTQPGRSGLGLKIVRRIAHRWNGELLIAPGPPGGLKIDLILPAV